MSSFTPVHRTTHWLDLQSCDLIAVALVVDAVSQNLAKVLQRPLHAVGRAALLGFLERCSLVLLEDGAVSQALCVISVGCSVGQAEQPRDRIRLSESPEPRPRLLYASCQSFRSHRTERSVWSTRQAAADVRRTKST